MMVTMPRCVISRTFSSRRRLSDEKERVVLIAQVKHPKEMEPAGAKTSSVQITEREAKRKRLDYKSNQKSVKHMGGILRLVIERDHAHCSAEYGLKAINSGSWFRS